MNDPGLHEPMNDATKDLEHNPYKEGEEHEEEEEQDFLDPSYANTVTSVISVQGLNAVQSLVVRVHGMSAHSRHIRAHGKRVQHLCTRE